MTFFQFRGEIAFEMKDSAFCYIIDKAPTDYLALSENLTQWLYEFERSKVISFNLHKVKL